MNYPRPVVLAGVSIFAIALLLQVGCESVDVGSESSVYSALAEATTERKAKAAVSRALSAAGIDSPFTPQTGANYSVSKRDVDRLASALASFNNGDTQAHRRTFRDVYEAMFLTNRHPAVPIEKTLEIMTQGVNFLLSHEAERDRIPLLLLAATHDSEPGSEFEYIGPDQEVSPVQAFMFGVWLHKHGPGLKQFHRILFSLSNFGKASTIGFGIDICVNNLSVHFEVVTVAQADDIVSCAFEGHLVGGGEGTCQLGACGDENAPLTCMNTYAMCLMDAENEADILNCLMPFETCVSSHAP